MPVLQSPRRLALSLLTAGLILRILLAWYPRPLDDDTGVYAELGRNLLHVGTYGIAADGTVDPSLFRLPGYPLLLGLLGDRIPLVLALQILLDLSGCVLLALLVCRRAGRRAGLWTLGLSATCLFTAIYAALPMTECLSVFAVTGALWAMGRLEADPTFFAANLRSRTLSLLPLAGFCALAMLLRPDGALLTAASAAALVWYGVRRAGLLRAKLPRAAISAALVCMLAAIPLIPWAIRNELTFHVFQPLAPRHVNDPGERVNLGFYRWLRTWSVEFSTTGAVFWHVGSESIDLGDLPPRAFDSAAQRRQTKALLARYNVRHDLDQQLDDDFGALADQRIHAAPLRYFVWIPALRIGDMWFRPRVDGTYLPSAWSALNRTQWVQVIVLGLLNLAYVAAALAAILDARARRSLSAGALMMVYVVARCALLGTMENPEPRYTLEGYPVVLVCAGVWLAQRTRRSPGVALHAFPGLPS